MNNAQEQRVLLTSWVLVERDPEADENLWVSHFLELDIISQGRTPQHAMQMLVEAVALAVTDDLNEGLDPAARGRAPQEQFDKMLKVVNEGKQIKLSDVANDSDFVLATQLTFAFDFVAHEVNQPIPTDRMPSFVSQDACAA